MSSQTLLCTSAASSLAGFTLQSPLFELDQHTALALTLLGAWHCTAVPHHAQASLWFSRPGCTVPGAALCPAGCSGVRGHGWLCALENELAKLSSAKESPSSQLRSTAPVPKPRGSCCVITPSQLSSRSVNEWDPQEERKHSQLTFKGGGLLQKSLFGHISKGLGSKTPGKQHQAPTALHDSSSCSELGELPVTTPSLHPSPLPSESKARTSDHSWCESTPLAQRKDV